MGDQSHSDDLIALIHRHVAVLIFSRINDVQSCSL